MRRRIGKFSRARMVALAVGLGALGSFAAAPAALAAQPPQVGSNCQLDGKINGGGSSFQTNAINDSFTYGFQNDVCGPVGTASNLNGTYSSDPSIFNFPPNNTSVAGMVAYNVPGETNGSGAGLRRLSCRTDFFGGSDLPYNGGTAAFPGQLGVLNSAATLGLDGPVGSESGGTAPAYNCNNGTLNTTAFPPEYGPQPSNGPWPTAADTAANAIAMPVAGGAVAFAINLNGMCTNTNGSGGTTDIPTNLNLTQSELDGIWQGTINQWNDPALVATNPILGGPAGPGLDNCSGNIQRVQRQDNSGTTAIAMFTLAGIDSAALCGSQSANHWYTNATASSNANLFPQGCTSASTGTTAPNAINSGSTGSPALITLLLATNGGIGYAELGLWPTPLPSGVSFANVQNHTLSAFVSPGSPGSKSNCVLPSTPPTGVAANAAVGLTTSGWSNNTNGGNPPPTGKQDIADLGSGYPGCGLTFDLAYQHAATLTGEIGGAGGTAGCTANPTTTSGAAAQGPTPLAGNSLTVTSTAGFPATGTISVVTDVGVQYVNYTSTSATSFNGIPISGVGSFTSGSNIAGGAQVTLITGGCQTASGPVIGMTNDQARTEYAYFTYVFSPLAQNAVYLPAQTLDPLPAGWLSPVQQGWQNNWAPAPF